MSTHTNMKNAILIGGITIASALPSQAVTVFLTEADAAGANLNVGTLTAPASEPADDAVVTTQTYTITDLALDGDAIANDTITFSFTFSAVSNTGGVGVITWDHSSVGVREYDIGGGTFNDVDESVTFGAITLTGAQTTSEGATIVLNSAVFSELTYRRWAANDQSFIDGDVTDIAVNGDETVNLNDTTFTTAWIDGTGTGDTWNLLNYDIDLDVTAVPEPSSTALLGLGGLALILRRRK